MTKTIKKTLLAAIAITALVAIIVYGAIDGPPETHPNCYNVEAEYNGKLRAGQPVTDAERARFWKCTDGRKATE
jgi:hypothetical protein